MLMSGGIWSAGAYLTGLFIVARGAFRKRGDAGNSQVFAALTLLCGLTQATTVNHLLPGIFFLCSTTIIACGYGLGFAEGSPVVAWNHEVEEAPDPDLAEATLEAASS